MSNLIALTGYARAGKDEAAKALTQVGWERRCFGDLIKEQIDPLVRRHLGFSAFTEIDAQKQLIRGTLEQWGESNYANIMREFFDRLPFKTVNTRLCRVAEGLEWRRRGGLIVEIQRVTDGVPHGASTDWERAVVDSLRSANLIDICIVNDGSPEDLYRTMQTLFVDNERPVTSPGSGPRTIRCSGPVFAEYW